MNERPHLIGGRWVGGGGAVVVSSDPATSREIWRGASAGAGEIDGAVVAARESFCGWAALSVEERIEHVLAYRARLEADVEGIAGLISREVGKPLWESRGEVGAMVGKVQLSIDAYAERCATKRLAVNTTEAEVSYRPHGVCAVYGPFNLPGHLPNGHIVPALIAGNTVVFKPSELAPAVGQRMVEAWDAAGLPGGVLNLVQGGAETGAALAGHAGLDGLFFTGGSATGRALSRTFAETPGKILALEMGGNNPLVVWGEPGFTGRRDLDAEVYLAVQSAYITAGQRCTCARRLILPDGPDAEAFLDRLAAVIATIKVGACTETPEPFMGPVIHARTAEQISAAQAELCGRGARSIVESAPVGGRALMLSPGLIDVTGVEDRADVEWFGPLLQVVRVGDFEGAIAEANRTGYGLAAALVDDSHERYRRFTRSVRAGVVNWNHQTSGASGRLPFGGVGASGNHRPSGYYAVDYCAYPVASLQTDRAVMPASPLPGVGL